MGKRGKTGEHLKGKFGKASNGFCKGWRLSKGYKEILIPSNHPMKEMRTSSGYILEHRLIMALHLKRPLTKKEIVHHIDENKLNNHIDNLAITSRVEHMLHHVTWDNSPRKCDNCPTIFIPPRKPRGKYVCCSRRCGLAMARKNKDK